MDAELRAQRDIQNTHLTCIARVLGIVPSITRKWLDEIGPALTQLKSERDQAIRDRDEAVSIARNEVIPESAIEVFRLARKYGAACSNLALVRDYPDNPSWRLNDGGATAIKLGTQLWNMLRTIFADRDSWKARAEMAEEALRPFADAWKSERNDAVQEAGERGAAAMDRVASHPTRTTCLPVAYAAYANAARVLEESRGMNPPEEEGRVNDAP